MPFKSSTVLVGESLAAVTSMPLNVTHGIYFLPSWSSWSADGVPWHHSGTQAPSTLCLCCLLGHHTLLLNPLHPAISQVKEKEVKKAPLFPNHLGSEGAHITSAYIPLLKTSHMAPPRCWKYRTWMKSHFLATVLYHGKKCMNFIIQSAVFATFTKKIFRYIIHGVDEALV